MVHRPEYQNWARKLVELTEKPELHELRDSLTIAAREVATRGGIPIGEWPSISKACGQAVLNAAENATGEEIGATLLLAVVANLAWSKAVTGGHVFHYRSFP